MNSKKATEEKFVEIFRSTINPGFPVGAQELLCDMVREDLNKELRERGGATKRTIGVRAWLKSRDLWVGEDI